MAETKIFTNPETARRYKPAENFNWNRRIQIPNVWSGPVERIPPEAVEALIKQGRIDFVNIDPPELALKQQPAPAAKKVVEEAKAEK